MKLCNDLEAVADSLPSRTDRQFCLHLARQIGPVLRAVLLTAAHDEATREKLRRVVESSLMGVSQLGVDEGDRLMRSGLISSQIMGLAMMRFVWKIEPVGSMTDDQLVAAVAPNLQHYIEGDLT